MVNTGVYNKILMIYRLAKRLKRFYIREMAKELRSSNPGNIKVTLDLLVSMNILVEEENNVRKYYRFVGK